MHRSKQESFSFSILWSIDNISCTPLRAREMLSSPTFKIEALGATEWNMVLFPRGVDEGGSHMSLYLHRKHGRPDLSSIAVDFKLSLDSYDTSLAASRLTRNVRFKEDDFWGFPNFMVIDLARYVACTSLTRVFTLRCEISPVDDSSTDVVATDLRIHLMTLSEDMKLLYETRQLHDIVLRCGGTELKAHRAVLLARSPKFFYRLKFDEDRMIADVPFMSGQILEMLVFYLYSGELCVPVSETPRELLKVAEQFELPDLVMKMRTYPDVCYARTILNVERKSVVWDVKSRHESDGSFVRILPTSTMYFKNMIVCCKAVSDFDKSPVQKIDAMIRLMDIKKELPVYVRCKILAAGIDGAFWEVFDEDRIFDSNEEWCVTVSINPGIPSIRVPSVNSVCFELDVCDGTNYSRMQDDWTAIGESPSLYHDFTQLSKDLELLWGNQDFSDAWVVCDHSVFPVHKAILAARSPVFEKMFRHNVIENQRGLVHVPDVTSEVMKLLLSYIYSGKVGELTYEDAGELYEAADKYAIIALRDKCSAFLLNVMEDDNADGILLLADMHFDFDFKEKVTRFIERNADDMFLEKAVLDSPECTSPYERFY